MSKYYYTKVWRVFINSTRDKLPFLIAECETCPSDQEIEIYFLNYLETKPVGFRGYVPGVGFGEEYWIEVREGIKVQERI